MNCKTYLSFKLPEQADDLKHALNGHEYKLEIEEFYNYLRNTCKHQCFPLDELSETINVTDRDKFIVYEVFEYLKARFIQDCPKGIE